MSFLRNTYVCDTYSNGAYYCKFHQGRTTMTSKAIVIGECSQQSIHTIYSKQEEIMKEVYFQCISTY